jgi:hypothetical protein
LPPNRDGHQSGVSECDEYERPTQAIQTEEVGDEEERDGEIGPGVSVVGLRAYPKYLQVSDS